MKLSIVTSLYKSRSTVNEFLQRATTAARSFAGDSYEIVLVNDGCNDGTVEYLKYNYSNDGHLVIVDLARNTGHHPALIAGLSYSIGDYVFLLDSDLEEQPEWLGEFADVLVAEDADVVFGHQTNRSGGIGRRVSGHLAWKAILAVSQLDTPPNSLTARLMTRRYVDSFLLFEERNVNLGGLFSLTGYKQVPLARTRTDKGSSSYSLARRFRRLSDAITDFSTAPLNFVFVSGIVILIAALVYLAYIVLAALLWNNPPVGWTTVVVSVWLIGGAVMSSLGIVAVYLGKVLVETKARPRAIVREVFRAVP